MKLEHHLWHFSFFFFVRILSAEGEAPVIIEHPLDVIVSKGAPATINCAAKPSSARITWFKDGQPVITNKEVVNSHRILLDTGALFLLRVNGASKNNNKDADSGKYHCVASNEFGEVASREGLLQIAMLRDDFRLRPRNVQALSGDRAVLDCQPPRGFPEPVVSWRKDDREIRIQDDSRLTLHPDGSLIIEPVGHSDSGSYVCVASNMVGERTSPSARLSVFEKPIFIQEPRDIVAEAGSSVIFDCKVAGEPQPQISWKKANDQMPSQRAHIAKDNRGLRIDKVELSDEGEYICNARNPAGYIEASAKLRVEAPPVFTIQPMDVTAEQGSKVTFECSAGGQPGPTLFWRKEGSEIVYFPGFSSPDLNIQVSLLGELMIPAIRSQDEGSYICAAVNSAGSSITTAQLKVTGKKALELRPPPIIEFGPANQTIAVGGSAILPCQAISGRSETVNPVVSWLFNGIGVDTEHETRLSQHSEGSLHIVQLRKNDSGVYTCRARNEDGESTWTASLDVEEVNNPRVHYNRMPDSSLFPSIPGRPTVSNGSHDSLDLTWTAPEKSASPVTGYVIQYYSPEEAQTWYNVHDYVSDTQHRVKNLKPNQSYIFVVRAENEKGIGPPSQASEPFVTLAAPETDSEFEDQLKIFRAQSVIKLEEVKTINESAVRLFWKRKTGLIDEGFITGYYVKWRGQGGHEDMRPIDIAGELNDNAIVAGLRPFSTYQFFVLPYASPSILGVPSNSLIAATAEAAPSLPPQDVKIRMLNLTTLRISWQAPKHEGLHGVLKGFQIEVIGKTVKFDRNISTNERAASVTFFHLIPGMSYKVRVAARTNAGIGVAHGTDIIEMNEETLERHTRFYSDESFFYSLAQKSWFIVIVVIIAWIILLFACVAFFMRRKKKKVEGGERMGPFIKINDGSVHMTVPPWGIDAAYHSAPRLNTGGMTGTLGPPMRQNGTMMPHYSGSDFYNPYQDDNNGTIARMHNNAEAHYHYAQVEAQANQGGYYGGQHYHDDPSPYATTTLVTTTTQPAWLNDRMLRGPALPTNPIPNGPPPRFASTPNEGTSGRRSQNSRRSELKQRESGRSNHTIGNDSPPHTDISYIQSSEGTGSSRRLGTTSERPMNIADFVAPPPPPGNPPPVRDDYDFPEGSRRPTSRNRTGVVQRGLRDDESQRSSLMDEENREDFESSGADGEASDSEMHNSSRKSNRPVQPVMGVSASNLAQSTYDSRTSTSRFKSLQRPSVRD